MDGARCLCEPERVPKIFLVSTRFIPRCEHYFAQKCSIVRKTSDCSLHTSSMHSRLAKRSRGMMLRGLRGSLRVDSIKSTQVSKTSGKEHRETFRIFVVCSTRTKIQLLGTYPPPLVRHRVPSERSRHLPHKGISS
jgi:hypothetical protein